MNRPKKHIVAALGAAVLAASWLSATAGTTILVGTNEVDAVEYANKVVARCASNTPPSVVYGRPAIRTVGFAVANIKRLDPAVLAQVDTIFSSAGFGLYEPKLADALPRCFANTAAFLEQNAPAGLMAAVRTPSMSDDVAEKIRYKTARVLFYMWMVPKSGFGLNIDGLRTLYARLVKHHLRAQGKSFVEKDGISPMQPYFDRLTASVNAPSCAGLADVLAEVGVNAEFCDFAATSPSKAYIDEFKRKILIGDMPFTKREQGFLKFRLGVDAYNAFVREYNDGKE